MARRGATSSSGISYPDTPAACLRQGQDEWQQNQHTSRWSPKHIHKLFSFLQLCLLISITTGSTAMPQPLTWL
jgi:hypothetical protein